MTRYQKTEAAYVAAITTRTVQAWRSLVTCCIFEADEIRERAGSHMTTLENGRLLRIDGWKDAASAQIKALNIAAHKARVAA